MNGGGWIGAGSFDLSMHLALRAAVGFELNPPGAPIKNPPKEVGCLLVRPEGFEPPTTWFEARYSIQLSYGRITGCANSYYHNDHIDRYSITRLIHEAQSLGAASGSSVSFQMKLLVALRAHNSSREVIII